MALILLSGEVRHQTDQWDRFAVIAHDNNQIVFSAKQWNDVITSYICQLQQGLSVMNLTLLEYSYLCHPRYVQGVFCSFS